MGDALIFVDVETTGLNASDPVIEIGILPVDPYLQPLDPGWSSLVHTPPAVLSHLNDTVREMHTANGLLEELAADDLPGVSTVMQNACVYLNQFGQPGELPMCGSSVHFDRKKLAQCLPAIEAWFHYRNVDVSTIKELWRRWYPTAGEPPKNGGHRALADCYDSVAELLWYKMRLQRIEPVAARQGGIFRDDFRVTGLAKGTPVGEIGRSK